MKVTRNSSAILAAGNSEICFGATPHTEEDLQSILEWVGAEGLIVDLRTDTERLLSPTTSFQYHTRQEITDENYVHFPITDRSVPTKKRRTLFREMLLHALASPRLYVHCRGGHGRSGVVVACLLLQCGSTASNALATVQGAHAARETLTRRMRLLGSPQNTKQKQYVREFTPTMEDGGSRERPDPDGPLHFYEATGEFGYLSNLWGTPGTTRWRELGGPTHLVIDDVCWPTVEHYFQAQKFDLVRPAAGESLSVFETRRQGGRELMQWIQRASTGAAVFRLGNIGHPRRNKSFKTGYLAKNRVYAEPGVEDSARQAPTINSLVVLYQERVRIRGDWGLYRNTVMMRALRTKFDHPALRDRLLSTGNRLLHEHTKRDLYWGDGMETNMGADMLGKMQGMLRTMYQHLRRHDMEVEGKA